jgi:hypothetical protein
MKLDAGNPNLMKAKATRINKSAPTHVIPTFLGDKNPKRYISGGPLLIERTSDMATPPGINIKTQPVYVPEKRESMRRGADDHMKYKSLGPT